MSIETIKSPFKTREETLRAIRVFNMMTGIEDIASIAQAEGITINQFKSIWRIILREIAVVAGEDGKEPEFIMSLGCNKDKCYKCSEILTDLFSQLRTNWVLDKPRIIDEAEKARREDHDNTREDIFTKTKEQYPELKKIKVYWFEQSDDMSNYIPLLVDTLPRIGEELAIDMKLVPSSFLDNLPPTHEFAECDDNFIFGDVKYVGHFMYADDGVLERQINIEVDFKLRKLD